MKTVVGLSPGHIGRCPLCHIQTSLACNNDAALTTCREIEVIVDNEVHQIRDCLRWRSLDYLIKEPNHCHFHEFDNF